MRYAIAILFLIAAGLPAQPVDPGRKTFETRCGICHGGDGNGGEMAPGILFRLSARDDQQLATLIRDGLPDRGMPPSKVDDAEMATLVRFLRSIQRRPKPLERRTVQTVDGKTLDGELLGEGFDDLQLRTPDRIHLLRRAGERYREVTSDAGWPSYNGDRGGNRYTTLRQIDKNTVARLAPAWIFPIPGGGGSQVTPVVVD